MIIITGTLAYDYIMEFPGEFGDHILPEHTHNINLSFIVNKFAKHRGGTAGNVSYTMGLLRTPHLIFSSAGSDFKEYKNVFDELGIDTSNILIDNNDHTATGFAMTDKASNQIWGYYYGAAAKISELDLNSVATKGDLVLIGPQGAKASMSFVRQCIDLKIKYMFDPGFILTEVSVSDLSLGVKNAEYIIGNEYEIELIRNKVSGFDETTAEKIIIKTLGKNGSEIIENGRVIKIGAVKAKKNSTTTGAGDAWRGGFLAGLARNFDIQTSAQMGSVAGSFAVEHFGAQEHTFTLKEFSNRYRHSFGDLLKL